MKRGLKILGAALGVVVVLVVGLAVLSAKSGNNQNLAAQQTCIDSANNVHKQSIDLLYAQTVNVLVNQNAGSQLAVVVSSQIDDEQSCYKQYPVTYSSQEAASQQQQCIANRRSYYKQFINIFAAQAANPLAAPNGAADLAAFESLQQRDTQYCAANYPAE